MTRMKMKRTNHYRCFRLRHKRRQPTTTLQPRTSTMLMCYQSTWYSVVGTHMCRYRADLVALERWSVHVCIRGQWGSWSRTMAPKWEAGRRPRSAWSRCSRLGSSSRTWRCRRLWADGRCGPRRICALAREMRLAGSPTRLCCSSPARAGSRRCGSRASAPSGSRAPSSVASSSMRTAPTCPPSRDAGCCLCRIRRSRLVARCLRGNRPSDGSIVDTIGYLIY